MPTIETALADLSQHTKQFNDETKERYNRLQCQVDALDLAGRSHYQGGSYTKTIGEQLVENPSFLEFKASGFRARGGCRILLDPEVLYQQKASITNVGLGSGTSGVGMPERLPGVAGLAMQRLRIRSRMDVRKQTTGASFDFLRQSTRTNAASPQAETSPKAESTYAWVSVIGQIRTIAHYTNVSRQALDDNAWLRSEIDGELMYGLLLKEEAEILSGSGVGEHLNGVLTQATLYNMALNVSGDTRLDRLRHAKLQARLAGLATHAPDTFVMHPSDLEKIELVKTEEGGANKGNYIIGDPATGQTVKVIWDLPVVESDSISEGTFLVGAFGTAATLIDRMEASLDISYEHNSNFTTNMATLLCECRLGLAVRVPSAFIYGSFGASSPSQ